MGLSASQARFLQLTARKSNVEYEAQQISQQRLVWASKLEQASTEYQDAISNRKMVFNFNNGQGTQSVDVSYNNYKNYMNQQMKGLNSSQEKMFLVSASGNKIVCANEQDMLDMMELNPDKGFSADDFMIVEGLDDPDAFKKNLQEGSFYFATWQAAEGEEETGHFNTQSWDTIGTGAIKEEYDKTDDAAAEAKFRRSQDQIQNIDKRLELELNRLETERNAIQTEMDSVKKVVEDNVEKTFQVFS